MLFPNHLHLLDGGLGFEGSFGLLLSQNRLPNRRPVVLQPVSLNVFGVNLNRQRFEKTTPKKRKVARQLVVVNYLVVNMSRPNILTMLLP